MTAHNLTVFQTLWAVIDVIDRPYSFGPRFAGDILRKPVLDPPGLVGNVGQFLQSGDNPTEVKIMRQQSSESGLVLLALLFFIAVTAVLLAMLIPSYAMRAKRDREEELIFRGAEYARAIKKFQNKYGALPLTVDELMMGSDGIPSLRRRYVDPTTGEEFRPIYVQTDGTLENSHLYGTLRDAITNTALTLAESADALADDAAANGSASAGGSGSTNANTQSTQGTSLTNPPPGGTATRQAGLVGVASQNDKVSVKIYGGQDRYLNWEFIAGIRRTVNRGAANATGNTGANGATSGGNSGARGGGND